MNFLGAQVAPVNDTESPIDILCRIKRQVEHETDRQTDRWKDRYTDMRTYGQTELQIAEFREKLLC